VLQRCLQDRGSIPNSPRALSVDRELAKESLKIGVAEGGYFPQTEFWFDVGFEEPTVRRPCLVADSIEPIVQPVRKISAQRLPGHLRQVARRVLFGEQFREALVCRPPRTADRFRSIAATAVFILATIDSNEPGARPVSATAFDNLSATQRLFRHVPAR
jgi:hypothetical protein